MVKLSIGYRKGEPYISTNPGMISEFTNAKSLEMTENELTELTKGRVEDVQNKIRALLESEMDKAISKIIYKRLGNSQTDSV